MALLDWDGDLFALPPQGEMFTYNGERYLWRPCNCRPACQRPLAFKNGMQKDMAMTTRLRGYDQGIQAEDIIAKFYGIEALVEATKSEIPQVINLWTQLVTEVEANGDINTALLESKDIYIEDYLEAKSEIALIQGSGRHALASLAAILVISQMLGGGGFPGGNYRNN